MHVAASGGSPDVVLRLVAGGGCVVGHTMYLLSLVGGVLLEHTCCNVTGHRAVHVAACGGSLDVVLQLRCR
jgi:hypothetical protein